MAKPIALQLYSLRERAAEDYESMIRDVADMGYVGVEPAGFPGTTAEAAAALYKELGLTVCSAHTGLPVGEGRDAVLKQMETLGTNYIVTGRGRDSFTSADLIKGVCDQFNEAAEVAAAEGMVIGYHNHWWEYQEVEGTGRIAYEIMLENLSPDVFFQIDTYWVQTGGQDVVQVLNKLGDRVKLLHIKDGPCVQSEPMTAVGQGSMDFAPIIEAAPAAEWLIVELDRCATDMTEAVRESVAYLSGAGLGRARD